MDLKVSSPVQLLLPSSKKMQPCPLVLAKPTLDLTPALPTGSVQIPSSSTPTSPSVDKTDNRDSVSPVDNMSMEREEERLKTFVRWPLTFISPESLAKNGFYYLGRGDEVRCAFCKVEIMKWLENDDPVEEHRRWAPQCPLLRRSVSGDIVSDSVAGRDECGVRIPTASTVRKPVPVHPAYTSEAARLRTFKDWPRSLRQKPEELAEAGFFYTGSGDKTKCFFCDGGLKDWVPEDIPWEQHARWFERCAYVHYVKGREYVEKVLAQAEITTAEGEKKESEPQPEQVSGNDTKTEVKVDDEKLCKICFVEERNICFVPCGHVVACAKCAFSTDKCPMCRRTFTDVIRLYFS